MRRKGAYVLLFSVSLACSLIGCGPEPHEPMYFAHVDRIEPSIAGFSVKGTRGVGGALAVINNSNLDVYLYDQAGKEQYKITATETFRKDGQGNWVHRNSSNRMSYVEATIKYYGSGGDQPPGRYSGEVMKEWVIAGRAGDTPFKIYGQTVYEPPSW